jgi:protein-disulfide isomerase
MIKRIFVLLFILVLSLAVGREALTEAADDLSELKKEIEALKQGQLQLQRELQEINAQLRRRQSPLADLQNVVLSIDGYPSKGKPSAKLILIEFTDYQCPFCSRHFQQTSPQIERDYVDTGQVRWVVRDFPIESIHKDALKAAEASRCAGEQGRYWQMHDQLFKNQSALAGDHLAVHAGAVGLDVQRFQRCLDSNKYTERIRQDLAEAQQVGVRATPSFLLGIIEPNGTGVKVTKMIAGAHPYAVFKEAIDSLLSVGEPALEKR